MNNASVLLKEWLPGNHYDIHGAVFHATVIRTLRNIKYEDKQDPYRNEPVRENWSGTLLLSIGPRIRLHDILYDKGLYKLEGKLQLLKFTLEEFLALSEEAVKAKPKEKVTKRVWLNAEEDNSHYTGYVSYWIEPTGQSGWTVSDCSKSIHQFLDYYYPRKSDKRLPESMNKFYYENIELLKSVILFIGKAELKIQELRDQFNALPPFEHKPKAKAKKK